MPKGLTRRYGQGHLHFVTFSWSQKKFVEKLQYTYMNPVKRRLVSRPKDWPWSSFRSTRLRTPVWSASIPCVAPVHEDQVQSPSLQKPKTGAPDTTHPKARATRLGVHCFFRISMLGREVVSGYQRPP